MSDLPESANVVVIGAGIVGNSVVGHLAELGWRDIVQIDKGPLPNPGGSTGHASNFIFPVDHNKEMAAAHARQPAPVHRDGLNTTCGGIEIAREPQRLEEFRRRVTSAKAWGIDAWLVSPEGGAGAGARSSTSPSSSAASTRRASPSWTRCRPAPCSGSGRRRRARWPASPASRCWPSRRTAAGCGPSSPTRAGSRRSTS